MALSGSGSMVATAQLSGDHPFVQRGPGIAWSGSAARPAHRVALPPPGGAFDYQLGGGYQPTPATRIMTRDRSDRPAAGLYNICYVNGFQTQPQETA